MSKQNYYIIEKNIEKIIRGEHTNFLDKNMLSKVIAKLKNYQYNLYYPYNDSEKVIIYTNNIPKVRILEIISYDKLTHREIMGSLYNLNIEPELFGDIIITNNHYYIIVMDIIYNYLLNNYLYVGKTKIKLKEEDLSILDNYQREYQQLELIASSLRIDVVVANITKTSRDNVKKKFLNDEVILNYELCHKTEINLKENDIFSIRKYGKYLYKGIIKTSKKNNYIIKLYKYIDN